MKHIMQGVFDVVFGFPGLMVLIIVGFGLLLTGIAGKEQAEKELRTKQAAYCYTINQVLVDTDAGGRCVAPQNLTVIK